jgi:hypothetical protein
MYHYLLSGIALLASAAHSFSQNSVSWGPEITVADGSVYGNMRPRMALTTGNEPVVVFGKNGGSVHVARWNGTAFATPVAILPTGLLTYLATWTGPDIAAHGDTVVATFKALPFAEGKIYAVRSTDGGITFSDTIRVDDHETGRSFLPAIAMDASGNPVINYMVFEGSATDPRYVITHSSDAGLSYSPGLEASSVNSGEACDCCPAEVVIDGNREALLYRNNNNNSRDVFAAYSSDGGATFPTGENLEELYWNVTSCPSTGPHGLFAGDSLYTVSANRVSGSYRVYISSATATTALTFAHQVSPIPPVNTNGTQNYPRISGENGTIVLAWEEKETNTPDIFCAVSTDGTIAGLTTYKARVNASPGGIQTNPDVIYKDGFVHIVYQDGASGDVIYRKGTIVSVTGISETATIHPDVYPNPSADGTFLVTGLPQESWKLSVADLSGKTVESTFQAVQGGWSVALSAAAKSGAYLLILEDASGNQHPVKLLLQR